MTWTVIQKNDTGTIKSSVVNAPHDTKVAWEEICKNLNDNLCIADRYYVIAIVPGSHPVHTSDSLANRNV